MRVHMCVMRRVVVCDTCVMSMAHGTITYVRMCKLLPLPSLLGLAMMWLNGIHTHTYAHIRTHTHKYVNDAGRHAWLDTANADAALEERVDLPQVCSLPIECVLFL